MAKSEPVSMAMLMKGNCKNCLEHGKGIEIADDGGMREGDWTESKQHDQPLAQTICAVAVVAKWRMTSLFLSLRAAR